MQVRETPIVPETGPRVVPKEDIEIVNTLIVGS
jgi:hypothetical protein